MKGEEEEQENMRRRMREKSEWRGEKGEEEEGK